MDLLKLLEAVVQDGDGTAAKLLADAMGEAGLTDAAAELRAGRVAGVSVIPQDFCSQEGCREPAHSLHDRAGWLCEKHAQEDYGGESLIVCSNCGNLMLE